MTKIRTAATLLLATLALSFVGTLAVPAIASADPWQPDSGPLHPIRHYLGDVEHPIWAITHPVRALTP